MKLAKGACPVGATLWAVLVWQTRTQSLLSALGQNTPIYATGLDGRSFKN
jgi:hypothetical protein